MPVSFFSKQRQNIVDDFFQSVRIDARKTHVSGIVGGLSGSALSLFLSRYFNSCLKSVFILTMNELIAQQIIKDLLFFSGSGVTIRHFADIPSLPYEISSIPDEILSLRAEARASLINKVHGIYIASVRAASKVIMPPDVYLHACINIKKKNTVSYSDLISQIYASGYERVSKVCAKGEFSVRGSIIDIFSPSTATPVRMEFFDDEIESIRLFNADTQISFSELETFNILPRRDSWVEEAVYAAKFRESTGCNTVPETELHAQSGTLMHCLPFFYQPHTIFDYCSESMDAYFVINPNACEKEFSILVKEYEETYKKKDARSFISPPQLLFCNPVQTAVNRKGIIIDPVHTNHENAKAAPVAVPPPVHNGNIISVKNEFKTLLENGHRIIVSTGHPAQAERIGELFSEFQPVILHEDSGENSPVPYSEKSMFVIQSGLSGGFLLPEYRLLLMCDYELFGRKQKIHREFSYTDPGRIIESFIDLNEGDYVVHVNEGIGIYEGLKKIDTAGRVKDYLKIRYQNNSSLYIPVEQMHLIQKYIGGKGRSIQIDQLGGKAWEKVKQRVKKSVETIAKDLVTLYALRKKNKKQPFPADAIWQDLFEADFPYDETPDQLKTAEDIRKDMESDIPMDRLVCGDVGFGKTEVAARAVFRAAMNSRQSAVLAPTTILSVQHYTNFTERFKNYPVNIAVINRFVKPPEIKKILEEVREGKIEVLIGTHRLLSKDVKFRDLGLLVIDEEQKFGVQHKEKIRKFANLVDTLTLTATPIPRTLHMSLINIRDVSIINTPPENRLPIQTYIMEFSEDVIKRAVELELKRSGQIFFVHNEVETIREVAAFLQKITPGIRIVIGHGQMHEDDLEYVMEEFVQRKADMLVCTTIIDSGLDIPNVNTIFINNAQNFGLSQLYQLKGRVGRSDRQAYAYFFYKKKHSLSEIALKRLNAIGEHTGLGSGMKIAMKDLDIRGAGNIIGEAQSGDIMSVGFEMYCQLMNEAIAELSEITPTAAVFKTLIDIKYDGYITDDYIPDNKDKIEIYKRIAGVSDEKECAVLEDEIKDRYGPLPEVILLLFHIARLRIDATRIRIKAILEKNQKIQIVLGQDSDIDRKKLVRELECKTYLCMDRTEINSLFLLLNQFTAGNKNFSSDDKIGLIYSFINTIRSNV